ncbi:MAG: Slp family lipoprotein [Gammaproteobacteria bacterium]|nr:Slp family lipoprotein [Gammaproteobacteria bacterium]
MRVLLIFLLLLLSACTSPLPETLRQPGAAVALPEARQNTSAYIGQRVRWGGTIAAVENRPEETRLDIVAYPLDRFGRPRVTRESHGRFLVRVDRFLDPAIYTSGREVTVGGSIEQPMTKPIGEHPYKYVVIKADAVYLWEPRVDVREPSYYRDPFAYDPFWPSRPYPGWYDPYPFYPYRR